MLRRLRFSGAGLPFLQAEGAASEPLSAPLERRSDSDYEPPPTDPGPGDPGTGGSSDTDPGDADGDSTDTDGVTYTPDSGGDDGSIDADCSDAVDSCCSCGDPESEDPCGASCSCSCSCSCGGGYYE